jgi:hypothetical protein
MSLPPRAQALIARLQLQAHPEGGWYRRVFESSLGQGRPASTAIYFLLAAGQASRWHRVDADELWHFYEGSPLELLIAEHPGELRRERLGPLSDDTLPQRAVPAQAWQAARLATGTDDSAYALVGCTVAPGFDFAGFRLLADDPEALAGWPRLAAEHPELV